MNSKKVVITGSSGFLGKHLVAQMRKENRPFTAVSSKDYDLTRHDEVKKLFIDHKPEVLIHLAAYSGGIKANRQFPADFYFQNIMLTSLVFEEGAKNGVKKLIYTMGGCSYPAKATSPIDESQMWSGYPQVESSGYAMAKKMGIVAADVYRKQFGLNSSVLIPGNMYGEYDNYHPDHSHVIPAMVRRYYEAKLKQLEEVTMWGSGRPTRDFVYVGDIAQLIPYFIDHDEPGPVNLSTGQSTSIKELAETVAELVGYSGKIKWDSSQPDGQMEKIFSPKKLNSIGLSCKTKLRDGLKKTVDWFIKNYPQRTDGIRL